MTEVYIVEGFWDSQDDCPDNWYNCSEHEIEAVFSTEEKALAYIKRELEEYLKVEEHKDERTYTKKTFPTDEQLLEGFIYRESWDGINWYSVRIEEVH